MKKSTKLIIVVSHECHCTLRLDQSTHRYFPPTCKKKCSLSAMNVQ
jgi:hypothetical protein